MLIMPYLRCPQHQINPVWKKSYNANFYLSWDDVRILTPQAHALLLEGKITQALIILMADTNVIAYIKQRTQQIEREKTFKKFSSDKCPYCQEIKNLDKKLVLPLALLDVPLIGSMFLLLYYIGWYLNAQPGKLDALVKTNDPLVIPLRMLVSLYSLFFGSPSVHSASFLSFDLFLWSIAILIAIIGTSINWVYISIMKHRIPITKLTCPIHKINPLTNEIPTSPIDITEWKRKKTTRNY